MLFPSKAAQARARSVREDWCARLPEQKRQFYDAAVQVLDSAFGMLSVALDEAIAQRDVGQLVRAREQVAISADLVDRLAKSLLEALRALLENGRSLSRLPEVNPLNPEFFRGETARGTALWHSVAHVLLPSPRLQFSQKLHALSSAVERVSTEFRQAAAELAEGTSINPAKSWQALECLQYDLNTCLQELKIVLKSFLHCSPDDNSPLFSSRREQP